MRANGNGKAEWIGWIGWSDGIDACVRASLYGS